MIDDDFLNGLENYTGSIGNTHAAEVIRNARRYLALRENEISIMQLAAQDFDHSAFRIEYDAAADRLLEGGG